MSLGVVVTGAEGVILAADTRMTLSGGHPGQREPVYYDNGTKVLTFGDNHGWVGAVAYGQATIGLRPVHSFMPAFASELGGKRLSVRDYAQRLSSFLMAQWLLQGWPTDDPQVNNISAYVAGYNEGALFGEVYAFDVPRHSAPRLLRTAGDFGVVWGGQTEVAGRLLLGYDGSLVPWLRGQIDLTSEVEQAMRERFHSGIPYGSLALQDCVDLANFLIHTTIKAQSFATRSRGVGGMIELMAITGTDGLKWIQRKELHGNRASET